MSFKQGGRSKNLSYFLIAINRRKAICKKIKTNRIQEQTGLKIGFPILPGFSIHKLRDIISVLVLHLQEEIEMNGSTITIIIIIAIIVLIALWLAGTYNSLVRKRNNAREGFSTMDVYLKKRFDLIPNLVETVKGYASHEKETLERVMQARSNVANSSSISEKVQGENQLTGALGRLFAVAENYPNLKANENFLDLQGQLKSVEQDIANARKYYNGTVKDLNNSVEQFPSNIVAGIFHFEKMPMFEAEAESRENVKVQF